MGNRDMGLLWWYLVNDLVVTLDCLDRRIMDFQQLNGRNVGVMVAMVLDVENVRFRFLGFLKSRSAVIGFAQRPNYFLSLHQIHDTTLRFLRIQLGLRKIQRGKHEWQGIWQSFALQRVCVEQCNEGA